MKSQGFEVWSATPTPFSSGRTLDEGAVFRMVNHHVELGINGIFVAGTCGEGPWMRDRDRRRLLDAVVDANAGRMKVAVQVTENSADQTLDRIAEFPGADYVVVAQPHFFMNATAENLAKYYAQILDDSPTPVIFYDRGAGSKTPVPLEVLRSICSHPNVQLVKDSSSDTERAEVFLECARKKNAMRILTGDEFQCLRYLRLGYHGMMVGGSVLTGRILHAMAAAHENGDAAKAEEFDARAIEVLYAAYGGKNISCWLSGLKWMLVQMGIFGEIEGYLNYPLTAKCKEEVESCLRKEEEFLFTSACRASQEIEA